MVGIANPMEAIGSNGGTKFQKIKVCVNTFIAEDKLVSEKTIKHEGWYKTRNAYCPAES